MIQLFNSTPRSNAVCFAIGALLATAAATAQVVSGTTGIDATGNTQSERVACTTGMTQQDRDTCLKEANNAAADKRAGKLNNNGGDFSANALARCEILSGADKIACQSRVVGYGKADGSVAGGGVIKSTETVVVPAGVPVVTVEKQTTNGPLLVIPAPR